MDIIHLKADYDTQNDDELKEQLIKEYTFAGYKPQVNIKGDFVFVHIDDAILQSTQRDFDKASDLCNQGKYEEAIPLFKEVVKTCPLHADAYRSMAQAYLMMGNLDAALDANIETLRIDSSNLWGLILMGNIFGHKKDMETAMTYYQKVLTFHPENPLALNNIGSTLMAQNKWDEAIEFFNKALAIDDSYMNSYYGLALAYMSKEDFEKAWNIARDGMIKATDRQENPQVKQQLSTLYLHAAEKNIPQLNPAKHIASLVEMVKSKYGQAVTIEEDNSLQVYAKLEYGPTYHRDYHVIKYNGKKQYTAHFVMHEFMHLYMALGASKEGTNMLVASNKDSETAFIRRFKKYIDNLTVRIGHEKVMEYVGQLHQGIVLQLMNGPLDLLVEDLIFRNYPDLRPLQMASLCQQEKDNVASIKMGMERPGVVPNQVFHASKILNMVTSMHLKELYGLDFLPLYKATKSEMDAANDLYAEYKAYRDDYEPGEEYDMMNFFIEQLDCEEFLTTVNEKDYLKRFEQPKAKDSVTVETQEAMDQNDDFSAQHKDGKDATETFMMSMYMVGALQYFEKMSKDQVRTIAFEIAMLGCGGINPANKSGYKVNSIPNKEFGGYELLAYYYVSWAIAVPEKLDALQLPFKTAYESALKLYNAKKK